MHIRFDPLLQFDCQFGSISSYNSIAKSIWSTLRFDRKIDSIRSSIRLEIRFDPLFDSITNSIRSALRLDYKFDSIRSYNSAPEEVRHGDVTTPISRARNVNYGWPVLRSIPPRLYLGSKAALNSKVRDFLAWSNFHGYLCDQSCGRASSESSQGG